MAKFNPGDIAWIGWIPDHWLNWKILDSDPRNRQVEIVKFWGTEHFAFLGNVPTWVINLDGIERRCPECLLIPLPPDGFYTEEGDKQLIVLDATDLV